MAINIPNKAFHSFSYKQVLNLLWRSGQQIDQLWQKEDKRSDGLKTLRTALETLQKHETLTIKDLAIKLIEIFPASERTMQEWLMFLERESEKDLVDSDFMVSTEDQFDKNITSKFPIHLVFDNLRSAFNVGSLFRSAEAFAIDTIHICGYTATPENSKAAKSALGTQDWINWKYWDSTIECIEFLRKEKVTVYALETESNAKSVFDISPKFPCAMILGNERYGLADPVLKRSDEILKIPLYGKKNSLNVGTCGAIVLNILTQKFEK